MQLLYRPCVGILMVHASGQIFSGERIDTPGAWQMPQGGIDEGETPRAAALRELEEEIGVGPELVTLAGEYPEWLTYDLPRELLGKVWKGRYRGQRQRWFLVRFNGRDEQIDIETAHPEFSRWAWLTPDQLLERIVPFKRAIYATVISGFSNQLQEG